MVFEIITDELNHENKYNYILSKNKSQTNLDNLQHLFQEFILSGVLVGFSRIR